MDQGEFRVSELLDLFATETENPKVIIKLENGSWSAHMRQPFVQGRGENDPPEEEEPPTTIGGCPFPPGCTP